MLRPIGGQGRSVEELWVPYSHFSITAPLAPILCVDFHREQLEGQVLLMKTGLRTQAEGHMHQLLTVRPVAGELEPQGPLTELPSEF